MFQELNWDKPDAENDKSKFIVDRSCTDYALRKGLDNVKVLYVKTKNDGLITRVIIENQEFVFENTSLEAICSHIDIMVADEHIK